MRCDVGCFDLRVGAGGAEPDPNGNPAFRRRGVTLFLAVAGGSALAYLGLTARPVGLVRSVVKTAAVAMLALAAGLMGASGWLIAALAFCALGDWLLSRDGETAFMAGIAAFAVGHLAYITLFLLHPLANITRIFTPPQIWLVGALLILGLVMARLLASRAGALAAPVLGYIPIILGMGVAVLALPGQWGVGWAWMAAVAFILSDLVLATERFILTPGHPALRWTPYVVWPLYWGAQAGFFLVFA